MMRFFVLLLFLLPIPALGKDDGRYSGSDPQIRSWFKAVQSPRGVPCCDIADSHVTLWEKRKKTQYAAFIEGHWEDVPDEAIVNRNDNPMGDAVGTIIVRCFVPGGGA